ncbi:helix-turn-helix domain-containing protein [Actinokineospora sp. NPDC004072]
MPIEDPAVARIQLGLLLRALRTGNQLSTMTTGRAVGTSNATISRVETGKQGISQADLLNLLDVYRASEEAVADALRLHAASKLRRRANAYYDSIPPWFRRFIAMEEEATQLAIYENEVVTGLFQTEDYARALMQAWTPVAGRSEIDFRVEQRMDRQEILTRDDRRPSRVDVVMLEAVLHRVIGDDEVMAGQLGKLLELSKLPNVSLRILPFRAAPTPNNDHTFVVYRPFTLLRLPEQGTLLYLEDFQGATYPEDLAVIERYSQAFERLRVAAADLDASREMITTMLKEYG